MTGTSKNNLFIVTSVINFIEKPISYSANRSIFNSKQREAQTLNTIRSIRKFAPRSDILLIEGGNNKNINKEIIKNVDNYIYVGDGMILRKAVDSSKKGLGECLLLIEGLKNKTGIKEYNFIFKISGRYALTDEFRIDKFVNNKGFVFKKYTNPEQVSTRLYGLSSDYYDLWINNLKKIMPSVFFNKSIEQALYIRLKEIKVSYVKKLGIIGNTGPDGGLIEE